MTEPLRPTLDAAIALFRTYFLNRTDRVAVVASRGKPCPAEGNGTLDALIAGHVRGDPAVMRYVKRKGTGVRKGRVRLGSYAPGTDNATRWLCLDFDGAGHADALADARGTAVRVLQVCEDAGLPAHLECSGGGHGWHLWCFFESPIPASQARRLGHAFVPKDAPLAAGGVANAEKGAGIEVFPKQDRITRKGYGNLVWLPWWHGAAEGANLFYRPGPDGGLEPYVPEAFETASSEDVEQVLVSREDAAHAECPAPAEDPATSKGEIAGKPAWTAWRAQALQQLDLERIYGPWLTGKTSGDGWLECRDPDASRGDRNPSAGVADGTGEAERGKFHSFRTEKKLSVFDFLIARGQAKNMSEAVVRVAEMSGVPLPSKATKATSESTHGPRLPQIRINNRQLLDIVGDAWRAVHAANKRPSLFRRSGSLARLEVPDDGNPPFIQTLSEPAVYGVLARTARWVRVTEDMVLDTLPLKEAARDMHVRPDKALPPIEAVVTTPVFGKDGELIASPGYHPDDRLWYHPAKDLDLPEVPVHPTPEQLAEARSLLLDDLLVDFPFVDVSDRAHAVAAMVLPFVRRMIDGCTPIHMVEAPSVGSGKGLICNLISILTTGKPADGRTLPVHEDEGRKMITAELAKGRPVILLDNAKERRTLDSPPLASVITSERWTDRILGRTEMITLPNQAVWLLTGNNLKLSLEIARRCVRVRIDPGMDRPWQRAGFKHDDVKGWARDHRAELIHAILVLVRAWLAAGRPMHPTKLGSFESWSAIVGGILQVAGIPGFLGDLEKLYETADVEGSMWREFVVAWWEAYGAEPKKVAELLAFCESRDLMGSVLGDGTPRSRQTRLGKALMGARDRVFDGYRVTRVQMHGKHKGGAMYALVPVEGEDGSPSGADLSDEMGTLPLEWGPQNQGPHGGPHRVSQGVSASSDKHGDLGHLSSMYARTRARTHAHAHPCTRTHPCVPAPNMPKVPMNDTSREPIAGCPMGTLPAEVPMRSPEVPIPAAEPIDLADLPESWDHAENARPP